VNPWNVLRSAAGGWKLVDFGAARDLARGGSGKTAFLPAPLPQVAYLAPEQVLGAGKGDPRSDVWSLGALLHRLLSGRAPFEAKSTAALAAAISKGDRAKLDGSAPASLVALVDRCLSIEPEARFQSGAELALELERAAVEPAPAKTARKGARA
jgi:serine/threonine-protein kinase